MLRCPYSPRPNATSILLSKWQRTSGNLVSRFQDFFICKMFDRGMSRDFKAAPIIKKYCIVDLHWVPSGNIISILHFTFSQLYQLLFTADCFKQAKQYFTSSYPLRVCSYTHSKYNTPLGYFIPTGKSNFISFRYGCFAAIA